MHELSLMQYVVKTTLAAAEKNNANKIYAVTLLVGKGRGFVTQWAQTYFDMLAAGSIAEGANVILEEVPGTGRCLNCGEIYGVELHENKNSCPVCGFEDYAQVTGNEMILKSIEMI